MQKKGKQVVSNWENDKAEPSISDLRRLAEILGTTAAWLMDGDTSISVVSEPPAGFTMVPTSEFIELQRQVIKQQKDELQKQK
jgi:transcriptional regulator with XRE-family HTH domain